LGFACPHARGATRGEKFSQSLRGVGQIARWFPCGLKKIIPDPFDKILINPRTATTNPAMIQHPFNLKFTIIIGRGTEPRVLHSVTSVAHRRFQLTSMENIMQTPGRR